MKVLIVGAGVIGTVFGAHLAAAGASVAVLAHGRRTDDVARDGLVARDVIIGAETRASVEVVSEPAEQVDLGLISVRRDQLDSTLQSLDTLPAETGLLLFGNNPAGRSGSQRYPHQIFLGFPGVAGTLVDGAAHYAVVRQQPTALEHTADPRLLQLRILLEQRGLPVQRVEHMDGWLAYHAVFIASICSALYRCGTDPCQLANNRSTLNLMCAAITEGFSYLHSQHVRGAPANLDLLHRWWLRPFAVRFWARTLRSELGEIYFGAHARQARAEMKALADDVLAIAGNGASMSNLKHLLGR